MGNGLRITTAPFRYEEGVHQGVIESGWFFAITCNRAFQRLNSSLGEHGGGLTAIVDDNYLLGPPEANFLANRIFARDLKEVGLKLQSAKSEGYIGSAHRDAR